MDLDDFFKIEPIVPTIMEQKEFFNKTKNVLEKIYYIYSSAQFTRYLKDDEYPNENICDECSGFGNFSYDGEEHECFWNKDGSGCATRCVDYEQIGIGLEMCIDDVLELLSIDEITPNEKN